MATETARLVEMAGTQRLPADMRRGETRDETSILRVLEAAVYEYTKGIPAKDLHDKKKTSIMYEEISHILNQFDCTIKKIFQEAWKILLCGEGMDPKKLLETIASVTCNRTLQHYITSQLRTPAKYKETLKRILHLGGSFESLFEEVGLNTVELAQKAHRIASDAKLCASLGSMIDAETFTTDSDAIVQQFYKLISEVQNDLHRNEYYNKFLLKLISIKSISLEMITILVQVYCFFVTTEPIRTVDPRIAKYLATNPIDFFRHQVQYMPLKLQPNSNFKREGFRLDSWQEESLQAIDKGHNIFMSARTSAGKSQLSTYASRNNDKVWFIVPTDPLVYQIGGINLASFMEFELRKGAIKKNVRLETDFMSYTRFPQADNIIVATPHQMVRLIQEKQVKIPNYIILDEFHNLVHPTLGSYYEYLLKFAGFHRIPLMALSATIPNFEEVRDWLTRLLPGPLFAVNLQKRFFNQKRMTFRVTEGEVELTPINPLNHMTIKQIRLPTFQQIGLYPQEILSLYESLPGVPRVDGSIPRLVSLDEMERLELDLFAYLKKQEDVVLEKIISDHPVSSDNLTLYQLYNFLRGVTIKPMIIFKMDSLACFTLFAKFVKMIQAYNKAVYGGFNGDKHIIKEYLEEVDKLEDSCKMTVSEEEDMEDKKSAMKELPFNSKYKPRLYAFYDTFLEETQKEFTTFNEEYGANLTYEAVLKLRQKHVRNEKKHTYESISVRNTYSIHRDAMIARTDGSNMKDIRNKINDELLFQLGQTCEWKEYEDEFSDFNKITVTRTRLIYRPKEQKWEEREKETKTIGHKTHEWSVNPYSFDDVHTLRHEEIVAKIGSQSFIAYKYNYNIDYEHPVLVGIECGLLFYNQMMNPALTRICQQLISKHPLIILSDHSLAVGINYPIKTVLLLGGLKDEPVEEIDNTLAHQAMGRAGRRGLDAEGIVIYSGVNITKILTPDYHFVRRNPPEAMVPLLPKEDAFKKFVLSEAL